MRKILTLSLAALVTACGSDEPQEPFEPSGPSPEEVAANKAAQAKEQAELAAIEYPVCDNVWSGENLSACGKETFVAALQSCAQKYGEGYRLDALSAGDSWIMRAGASSMLPFDERAASLERTDNGATYQSISYALGDGTDDILMVTCTLDEDVQLSGGWSSRR